MINFCDLLFYLSNSDYNRLELVSSNHFEFFTVMIAIFYFIYTIVNIFISRLYLY